MADEPNVGGPPQSSFLTTPVIVLILCLAVAGMYVIKILYFDTTFEDCVEAALLKEEKAGEAGGVDLELDPKDAGKWVVKIKPSSDGDKKFNHDAQMALGRPIVMGCAEKHDIDSSSIVFDSPAPPPLQVALRMDSSQVSTPPAHLVATMPDGKSLEVKLDDAGVGVISAPADTTGKMVSLAFPQGYAGASGLKPAQISMRTAEETVVLLPNMVTVPVIVELVGNAKMPPRVDVTIAGQSRQNMSLAADGTASLEFAERLLGNDVTVALPSDFKGHVLTAPDSLPGAEGDEFSLKIEKRPPRLCHFRPSKSESCSPSRTKGWPGWSCKKATEIASSDLPNGCDACMVCSRAD